MKKILVIVCVMIGLSAEDLSNTLYVKNSGVIKKINLTSKVTSRGLDTYKSYATPQNKKFDRNVKILLKPDQTCNIEEIANKYELKIDKKLITGHYLMINNSQKEPQVVLKEIIDNEKGVISIFPNWKLNKKKL
jgi:hypothetical protein